MPRKRHGRVLRGLVHVVRPPGFVNWHLIGRQTFCMFLKQFITGSFCIFLTGGSDASKSPGLGVSYLLHVCISKRKEAATDLSLQALKSNCLKKGFWGQSDYH